MRTSKDYETDMGDVRIQSTLESIACKGTHPKDHTRNVQFQDFRPCILMLVTKTMPPAKISSVREQEPQFESSWCYNNAKAPEGQQRSVYQTWTDPSVAAKQRRTTNEIPA